MKTFYCVETKVYDTGKIKARMFSREAETIPANTETETDAADIYIDWFEDETEAKKFLAILKLDVATLPVALRSGGLK